MAPARKGRVRRGQDTCPMMKQAECNTSIRLSKFCTVVMVLCRADPMPRTWPVPCNCQKTLQSASKEGQTARRMTSHRKQKGREHTEKLNYLGRFVPLAGFETRWAGPRARLKLSSSELLTKTNLGAWSAVFMPRHASLRLGRPIHKHSCLPSGGGIMPRPWGRLLLPGQ